MINEVLATVKDRTKIDGTINEFKKVLAPYDVIKVTKKGRITLL